MGQPVAMLRVTRRIHSVLPVQNTGRFSPGVFLPTSMLATVMGSAPDPVTIFRSYTFAVAQPNLVLNIGDLIVTTEGAECLFEFFIGGQGWVRPNSAIEIVNQRSVFDTRLTWQQSFRKWMQMDVYKFRLGPEIYQGGVATGIKG